jgi:hypothetical protein
VILAGDFNSTETLSSFDTGRPLSPSEAKDKNTAAIQEFLNDWRFMDLWTRESNKQQEAERKNLEHLTHWNHKHTRRVCIDRVYANFRIEANVTVSTHHHPGSDHRGVLYSWSHRGHIDTSPPNRPLPHRPFKLRKSLNTIKLY